MEEKILILGKNKPYSFTDEKTGQVFEGQKISYLSSQKGENGHLPIQVSLDLNLASKVDKVPGVYTARYGLVPGKGNKPQITLVDLNFLSSYEVKF